MLRLSIWLGAAALGLVAGWIDLRSRRIPNWLTLPGLLVGIALNAWAYRALGAREALIGAILGLALLLPFVLIRVLGAGDWKLVGAAGAFTGPHDLLTILFIALIINGLIAVAIAVRERRAGQIFRNIGHILNSFLHLQLPAADFTLDNPKAIKVPFGVAFGIAMIGFAVAQIWQIHVGANR